MRTRERAAPARQASGTERGAGGGGATAHTLAHTRSHSTPGRSLPEGPRGCGRGERCNLLATLGNWTDGRRRGPPRPPRGPRHPGPDGACTPAARHGPRPGSPPPPPPLGRAGVVLAHPTPRKRRGGGGRPSLSGARLGGKLSFSSFSSASFPPPPSSATPDPFGSSPGPSRQQPPAPLRMTAGWLGELGRGPQQRRGGGPRHRPRPSCAKCVT